MKYYTTGCFNIAITVMAMSGSFAYGKESWTGFVPRSSIVHHEQNHKASSNHNNSTWQSGFSFNQSVKPVQQQATPVLVNAKYEQTAPQRTSVNPWSVDKRHHSKYDFEPFKRPWGSVPQMYQNKFNNGSHNKSNYQLNGNHGINHYQNNFGRNMMVNYRRSNFSARSNSLLPIAGHYPLYFHNSPFNNNLFFPPGRGYSAPFLWR